MEYENKTNFNGRSIGSKYGVIWWHVDWMF